jgi:hypothetical protein
MFCMRSFQWLDRVSLALPIGHVTRQAILGGSASPRIRLQGTKPHSDGIQRLGLQLPTKSFFGSFDLGFCLVRKRWMA